MKKLFIILGAAALVLASCAKSETVVKETPGEISFKAISANATKGAEVVGTEFAAGNLLVISATAKEKNNYFTGVTFKKDATTWRAYDFSGGGWAPVYWPAGEQRVDFLAYGLKDDDADATNLPAVATILGVTPAFDATRPADMLTVSNWNVYDKQADFLYAAANNKYKTAGVDPVAMEFQHATSMLIFNLNVSQGPDITVTDISFDDLIKTATFTVDNTKTNLVTKWEGSLEGAKVKFPADGAPASVSAYNSNSYGASNKYNNITPAGKYNYNTKYTSTSGWGQLGETFMVVPQERQSFTITYKIGADATTEYTFYTNINKGEWEAGKIYIYNIDFNLREIQVTPTVKEWEAGSYELL